MASADVMPKSPLEVLSQAASLLHREEFRPALSMKELHPKFRKPRCYTAEAHRDQSNSPTRDADSPSPSRSPALQSSPEDAPLDFSLKKRRSSSPPPYSPPARRPPPPSYEAAIAAAKPAVLPAYPAAAEGLHVDEQETGRRVSRPSVICQVPRQEEGAEPRLPRREVTIVEENGAIGSLEEHFRKSLGEDYSKLFQGQKQPAGQDQPKSKTPDPVNAFNEDLTGCSVDDHFAKALGETWTRLQAQLENKENKRPLAGHQHQPRLLAL